MAASTNPPEPIPLRRLPDRFDCAVEQRARGASWVAAAREVGRSERTLRKWAERFPDEWRRALSHWEAVVAREAAAESVFTLRMQLRSDDEKVVRAAADSLIQYALARAKTARAVKSKPGSVISTDAAALAEFLGELTDAEQDTLLAHLRSSDDAGVGHSRDTPDLALAKRSE